MLPEDPSLSGSASLSLTGGVEPGTLTRDQLDALRTPPLVDGQGKPRGRSYWNLREVADYLGVPSVVRVVARSGEARSVDQSEWEDSARVPSLVLSRRGLWRFQWVSPLGVELSDVPAVDDVVALSLAPRVESGVPEAL